MAGDWIKMTSELHEKPEVVNMAIILNLHELDIVGRLFRIWSWADQQTLNGNGISVTALYLDRLACTQGFADALRKVGWLEGRDNALTFPHFERHNGQTAKDRALTAKRVSLSRAKKCNGQSVTSVTVKALPEKRREEENIKKEDTIVSSKEKPSRWRDSLLQKQAEEIYEAYPRKEGKQAALKSIAKALGSVDYETLLEKVKEFAIAMKPKIERGEIRYVKQPATWFNQGCWMDDVSAWKDAPQGKHNAPSGNKCQYNHDNPPPNWRDLFMRVIVSPYGESWEVESKVTDWDKLTVSAQQVILSEYEKFENEQKNKGN